MTEVNEMILEKLKEYPRDIYELGKKAIELSESYPEASIVEQLKSVVRRIVHESQVRE